MTNYEYLIDKYPNLVKEMLTRFIAHTVLCFDDLCNRFSDCSKCPFADDAERLITGREPVVRGEVER